MANSPIGDPSGPGRDGPRAAPFDLDRALSSVVALRSRIPEDAFTASMLGTERAGNGVLIGDRGLVVTIGYLITEAEEVWLVDSLGRAAPAHVIGYDQETGFGLVQALQRLDLPAMPLGSSEALGVGERVYMAGHGGRRGAIEARVVGKREFAGYWEYLLEEAIFTAPAHPSWGGAALVGMDGSLRGIGSLFVQQQTDGGRAVDGNMIVPIDLLKPILDEMVRYGRVQRTPRPWLGLVSTEANDAVVVVGLTKGGPAAAADIELGDIVLGVAGRPVSSLAEMFRRIWALGEAGVAVPLTLLRNGERRDVTVRSVDRASLLRTPRLH